MCLTGGDTVKIKARGKGLECPTDQLVSPGVWQEVIGFRVKIKARVKV